MGPLQYDMEQSILSQYFRILYMTPTKQNIKKQLFSVVLFYKLLP